MEDSEPSRALAKSDAGNTPDAYEREYMKGEGLVLHRAKQRAPWFLHAIFGAAALSVLLPVFAGQSGALLGAAIGLPIVALAWMLFAVLRVTVSEGNVNVQYGLIGPTIPVAAIESAKATRYHWTKFGGWGIRRNLHGEWIYSMPGDKGRAVRVVWRNAKGRKKVTFIGSSEHEALAEAIATARKALPAAGPDPVALPTGGPSALPEGQPADGSASESRSQPDAPLGGNTDT
ncbi:MAG: hypothetical protein K0V04_27225 [Deltaproteobacteria bacterium]|nr:hypothetical protein [Deltaproteobacteria bacterium]